MKDPYFILTYDQQAHQKLIPFIDFFNKSGQPIQRINIMSILRVHEISLHGIQFVKVPTLEWSARSGYNSFLNYNDSLKGYNQVENDSDSSDGLITKKVPLGESIRKLIVVGECFIGLDHEHDAGLSSSQLSIPTGSQKIEGVFTNEPQTSPFIMQLNFLPNKSNLREGPQPQMKFANKDPHNCQPYPEIIKILRLPQPETS